MCIYIYILIQQNACRYTSIIYRLAQGVKYELSFVTGFVKRGLYSITVTMLFLSLSVNFEVSITCKVMPLQSLKIGCEYNFLNPVTFAK